MKKTFEGSPKFLLHGISGVFNYGCEAIVRTTVDILKEQWPECHIAYASRRPKQDGLVLEDCDLEIIDNRIPNFSSPTRLLNSYYARFGRPEGWIAFDKKALSGTYDYLVSIGGDIFTLRRPSASKKVAIYPVDCANWVMDHGKKYVLWGASVGPYDSWPESIPVFKKFLSRCELITAREPETVRYLSKLGISSNVTAVADPAFLLPAQFIEQDWPFGNDMTPVLGMNLSPLASTFASSGTEQFLNIQVEMVIKVVDALGVNVLFIPHVIASQVTDDDYRTMHRIHQSLPEHIAQKVRLLPPHLGAMRTKGMIQHCDALIAARMHCCIAGVSSGTPTLFLSYSRKSVGMAEYVYGNSLWVYKVEEFYRSPDIAKLATVLQTSKEMRSFLNGSKERFVADARLAGTALKRSISANQ